ncbi:MAG: DUF4393 domain-containing protein [Cetobacterium sp.]
MNIPDITEGINQVIPKVYEDALQPSVKIIGTMGETLTKTINTALLPLRLMIWKAEEIENNIIEGVKNNLKDQPVENIQTPNPRIAGPIFENLRYTAQESEIREMYISLLSNAMNKETAGSVHPLFVDLIKQLSSLDCIVFKELTNEFIEHSYRVIIDNLHLIIKSFKNEYNLLDEKILTQDNILFSLENLIRQGLFEIVEVDPFKNKQYEKLPLLRGKNQFGLINKGDKIIRLTYLGQTFKKLCL